MDGYEVVQESGLSVQESGAFPWWATFPPGEPPPDDSGPAGGLGTDSLGSSQTAGFGRLERDGLVVPPSRYKHR